MARTVALMLLAMSLIPLGDTAGKMLVGAGVSPFFVGWSRFALGVVLVLPFMAGAFEPRIFLDWRIWLRGALIGAGVACILTALRTEPLANVFGAFFVGPILSYFLSGVLLGERLSTGRTLLLLMGFAGVLLVVQPGFGMTVGLGFAVAAGVFYGLFLVASRWVADVARPRALLLSQVAIAALVLAPFGLSTVPAFSWPVAGLVLWSAAGSTLGNLMLVMAFRRAEAGQLAPFVYFQLIAATILGWLFFGELPGGLALVGLTMLVGAGFGSLLLRRG
ncbi:DMT family transporter [Dinoroseobacter sp. PD6]|uniref:DMT family transporter n=1 Tax=Dinoroseobacter sp. PD6 TaxID=3028384 RepID=UPI00237A34FB|nr:DMT family transporter [Dinoroseobacter sp. PD6]MDD9716540.1 DMT family transporter [Dinoroseobacter sp. PD6]